MPIPAPKYEDGTVSFQPIIKVGYWVPFGYREDPEDKNILRPITKELMLLEDAKKYLAKGFSLRDVALWLSTQSGRTISHQGLKVRVAQEKAKHREYTFSSNLAKQFAEAYKKARKLEATWAGEIEPSDSTIRAEILKIASEAEPD